MNNKIYHTVSAYIFQSNYIYHWITPEQIIDCYNTKYTMNHPYKVATI